MSKKSKKILAYLMFVAALCGTPAVSEARGGSGGQVKTEKASVAQRGSLDQSFTSYLFGNYAWEAFKLFGVGGSGYELAKFLKAGDLSTWARYLSNSKSADLKKAEDLMKQYNAQKKVFDKEKKEFDVQREKALNDNTKLNNEKVALELSNKTLNAKVKESEKKIEELENSKAKLSNEVLDLKNCNNQLLNVNDEDNKRIDTLLSGFLPYKMMAEFDIFTDESWQKKSYKGDDLDKVDVTPRLVGDGVRVALVRYDSEGKMLGEGFGWSYLPVDGFLDAIAGQANGDLVNISLKDIGLDYCGIPYLARYSYDVGNGFVSAYFPVKSVQEVNNAENNENNENNGGDVDNNENNNN